MTDSTHSVGASARERDLWPDLLIGGILLVAAGIWAASFLDAWHARGGRGDFYQEYFEPAVMVACGKGFVISELQPKPLEDFLFQRRDTLSCADIPESTPLGTQYLYQGAWRYLLAAVGLWWRICGISWSGLNPLLATMFGVVIVLGYGIFRLGMSRWIAVACSIAFAVSTTHLVNLPHLRDYAKAPFTLAMVLLIGLMVVLPVRRVSLLALSLASGVVLGIGYGFRADLLITAPIVVLVLGAFLEGGASRHLGLRATAIALFAISFGITSWPITSTVYRSGGCQWHVALLGLQAPFDEALRIRPAPYDFGHAYSDVYVDRTINGYHKRVAPEAPELVFCGREYDEQSARYMGALVTRFPADFIVRSYASVLQIAELPFRSVVPPVPGWMSRFYEARRRVLDARDGWGGALALGAVVAAGAIQLRWAMLLLVVFIYFGGYPAVQFQERHYFHLEFMSWWTIGYVLNVAYGGIRDRLYVKRHRRSFVRGAAYSMLCVAGTGVTLVGALGLARWYQVTEVRELIHAYHAAPKVSVDAPSRPLPDASEPVWPQLLAVELRQEACGDDPSVVFRYESPEPALDFTRTVPIHRRSNVAGTTVVFQPVFEHYAGVEVIGDRPGCISSVSRVSHPQSLAVLLGATLPPDWELLPLHQSLLDWESEAGR